MEFINKSTFLIDQKMQSRGYTLSVSDLLLSDQIHPVAAIFQHWLLHHIITWDQRTQVLGPTSVHWQHSHLVTTRDQCSTQDTPPVVDLCQGEMSKYDGSLYIPLRWMSTNTQIDTDHMQRYNVIIVLILPWWPVLGD